MAPKWAPPKFVYLRPRNLMYHADGINGDFGRNNRSIGLKMTFSCQICVTVSIYGKISHIKNKNTSLKGLLVSI